VQDQADGALLRLLAANRPGHTSLAGAYALGYAALGLAQQEAAGPDWFHELDPLDTLFLGTVWPGRLRDAAEFGNARTAWLRLLRGTQHWRGVERFVIETVAASEEHRLPVDEGELMLLLVGRLESAGLDQHRLPESLLPATALAGARCVEGAPADLRLPAPPADAEERVRRLWAGTEVGLRHDGTAADALREGLHLLGKAGLPVRDEAVMLLPALYVALVAGEYEPVAEAGERAVAWALGLAEDGRLLPVVDVLLAGPERGLDVDTVLGHLFAVPAFTEPVEPADRRWHSAPATDLVDLAFELGHTRVDTRDSKVLRLDRGDTAVLQAQVRRFEAKFGRPPGPEDPLFFDPDADQPQPVSLAGIEQATVGMLEAAGICPAWIYAHQHTGGLLPRPDGTFVTDADHAEWTEAVDRYLRLHPDDHVDPDSETGKLRVALAVMTIDAAAGDPGYAATLVDRLRSAGQPEDIDIDLMEDYLHATAGLLTARLRDDPQLRAAATELARAAGGADLADQVNRTADAQARPDTAVLLLTAAAETARHHS
jgi:hypothetical protein